MHLLNTDFWGMWSDAVSYFFSFFFIVIIYVFFQISVSSMTKERMFPFIRKKQMSYDNTLYAGILFIGTVFVSEVRIEIIHI